MILLVIGGSASGKSEYAENRALELQSENGGDLCYIATMQPFGQDARKRIKRHQMLRAGKGFETVERYTDLSGLVREPESSGISFSGKAKGSTILLECMSNLCANEIFSPEGAGPVRAHTAIIEGIQELSKVCRNLIIVTIDVFGDGQVYDPETEEYKKCLAGINEQLARLADEVEEIVYSVPVKIK